MLSRDADAMYWMARYVERAEHVARLLLVNSNLLIDVGDLAAAPPGPPVAKHPDDPAPCRACPKVAEPARQRVGQHLDV